MHERYRTRTRIFWKIFGIVLISIIFCVLVTSGFMYFYMKPLVENSLIEKRRDMVLNLSEQEVNTLEEISLYAMNITFDDTVQNIFKIEEPENSYMFFAQIQTMEKKLTIEGMSCGHCSARVEKALNGLDGVSAVVDLDAKTATVKLAHDVADAELKKAVEDAGYTVTGIE